ncbi:MAG: UDP-N-acetylmuramoyl-L-alanine--D-glutamate ligase [Candidatus Taylorbacteria bacterium]|nr:UDP-N-acetylmuramoyl-L-alanine--D-glutamate ligase [Candidatus Taylorbacteria bacterium]
MTIQSNFKGKKITVMGLGLLGRGVNDVKFLAENGADLIVTDLKTREELAPSIAQLTQYKNITYVLGEHRLEDFRDRDLIIKMASVPLDSIYTNEAKKNGIPVEMSTALFARLTEATVVGITGTRGKSTVTHLLYEILKSAFSDRQIFIGGNIKGMSTLPLLDEAKKGDIAVLELDSWQLQGFGESKLSPHVAIFTTFYNDHLNYYKNDLDSYLADKANIFLSQKPEDFLVLGSQASEIVLSKYKNEIESKIIIPEATIGSEIKTKLLGEHNKYNIALAIEGARIFGVKEDVIKKVVEDFKGVPFRLELVRTIAGVNIYNDTTATTPEATIAGLEALNKNIILIMGGTDKNLDMTKLISTIPKYCKEVIVLSGTGTERIKNDLVGFVKNIPVTFCTSLDEAVKEALKSAKSGDSLLFSPAFASFGMFKNEFDRGEKFNKIVLDICQ